jgi:hypothetical protein
MSTYTDYGITVTRDLPLYEDMDYWMMDVDWFDMDEVIDYIGDELLYCDYSPTQSNNEFGDFTEYPWWWGANYCL